MVARSSILGRQRAYWCRVDVLLAVAGCYGRLAGVERALSCVAGARTALRQS